MNVSMKKSKNLICIFHVLCVMALALVKAADAAQEAAPQLQEKSFVALRRAIQQTEEQFLECAQQLSGQRAIQARLIVAVFNGFVSGVKYLVEEKKANIYVQDASGNNLLHLASRVGHLSVIDYLIRKEPRFLKAVNKSKETPFLAAAGAGKLESMLLLLKAGKIDLSAETIRKQRAIHLSSGRGHLPIVRHLVEVCEVSPNQETSVKITPLMFAVRNGQVGVVQYLVRKGANIHSRALGGQNALHLAAAVGKLRVVKLLIERYQFPVDGLTYIGATPLSFAAGCGHIAVMEYLIEKGAKINGFAAPYQTPANPLLHALNSRQIAAAIFLIRQGAHLHSTHFAVAKITGQFDEILVELSPMVAAGGVDINVFASCFSRRNIAYQEPHENDVGKNLRAWFNSEEGKACMLFTELKKFLGDTNRQQAQIRFVEALSQLSHYVPRNIARLILSEFLPTPPQQIDQQQDNTTTGGHVAESCHSNVGHKRYHNGDGREGRGARYGDGGALGADLQQAEPSAKKHDDTSGEARATKRQRRG